MIYIYIDRYIYTQVYVIHKHRISPNRAAAQLALYFYRAGDDVRFAGWNGMLGRTGLI